jgi:hypothetical protein
MARQPDVQSLPPVPEKPTGGFYATWILLTVLAVPTAFVLTLLPLSLTAHFVGDYIYVGGVRHITEDYLVVYFWVPLAGLLIGALQFLLLRQVLPRMGWWVPATLGGWLLGALLVALPGWLGWTQAFRQDIRLAFLLMGLGIGAGQWPLLRRRLPRAAWWIPANLAGGGLLALVTPGNSMGQFGLLPLGFFQACTTAAALALLLGRGAPATPAGDPKPGG